MAWYERASCCCGVHLQGLVIVQHNSGPTPTEDGQQEPILALKGDSELHIQLPGFVAFFSLNGYVGPNYGIATITITPPPPGNLTAEMSFSTSRAWFSPMTLFYTPLDYSEQYNVTISTQSSTAGHGVYLNNTLVIANTERLVFQHNHQG